MPSSYPGSKVVPPSKEHYGQRKNTLKVNGLAMQKRMGQERLPKPYRNGGLRMQNEEGGGAPLGGEMPWNAMLD